MAWPEKTAKDSATGGRTQDPQHHSVSEAVGPMMDPMRGSASGGSVSGFRTPSHIILGWDAEKLALQASEASRLASEAKERAQEAKRRHLQEIFAQRSDGKNTHGGMEIDDQDEIASAMMAVSSTASTAASITDQADQVKQGKVGKGGSPQGRTRSRSPRRLRLFGP